jgi:hypothetical protein
MILGKLDFYYESLIYIRKSQVVIHAAFDLLVWPRMTMNLPCDPYTSWTHFEDQVALKLNVQPRSIMNQCVDQASVSLPVQARPALNSSWGWSWPRIYVDSRLVLNSLLDPCRTWVYCVTRACSSAQGVLSLTVQTRLVLQSLCGPGQPGTHHVIQSTLELTMQTMFPLTHSEVQTGLKLTFRC